MLNLKSVLFALACALPAAEAAAEIIEVRMERRGFYPDVIYAEVGDTIRFTNELGRWFKLEPVYSTSEQFNHPGALLDTNADGVMNNTDHDALNLFRLPDSLGAGVGLRWLGSWYGVWQIDIPVTPIMARTIRAPRWSGFSYGSNSHYAQIVIVGNRNLLPGTEYISDQPSVNYSHEDLSDMFYDD